MAKSLHLLLRPATWIRPGELQPPTARVLVGAGIALVFVLDVLSGAQIDLAPLYLGPLLIAAVQLPDRLESAFYFAACVVLRLASIALRGHPHASLIWAQLDVLFTFVPTGGAMWLARSLRATLLRARRISLIDHLTGVGNRRDFESRLAVEIDRQDRYGGSFSLALIDLDNFKTINDSWGHSAGDHTLRTTAESIMRNTRRSDIVGRLGGDEFGVVMLNTTADDARRICTDILQAIEARTRAGGHAVTASIGCMSFTAAPESLTRAMQQVDEVMYGVKRTGKGGVASV